MPHPRRQKKSDIFINCPFDRDYQPVLQAILFTTIHCGFRPRVTLECNDSGRVRFEKLLDIIAQCRYGIHDLSRTELDDENKLPRFNMPFELGVFLGARYLGEERFRSKKCLILDHEPYRYQKFLSDVAGQDIKAHGSTVNRAIKVVRDWLSPSVPRIPLPGPALIQRDYQQFLDQMPDICQRMKLDTHSLPFSLEYIDFLSLATEWIRNQ